MQIKNRRWLLKWVFISYCLVLLWLLFLQRLFLADREVWINLRPFHTIDRFIWVICHGQNADQRWRAWVNLLGNLVLFLPWGILMPMLFPAMKRAFLFLLCTLGTIATVELSQYGTHLGVCDIDDLILNFIGAFAGWIGWRIWTKNSQMTE